MDCTNIKDTLPNKLSELLIVALEDLEQIENDPNYDIDMGEWYKPKVRNNSGRDVCTVCHAGAVMVNSLNLKPSFRMNLHPDDFTSTITNKLMAINAIRIGRMTQALSYMGVLEREGIYSITVVPNFVHFLNCETTAVQSPELIYTTGFHLSGLGLATISVCSNAKDKNPQQYEFYKLYIETVIGILESEGY